MSSRLADRLTGALLGTALGDGVGAPFEGMTAPRAGDIESLFGAESELRWTDDTHMALALADSLADHGGTVHPEQLGESFARAYRQEPWRGYGAGPPQIFAMTGAGMAYGDAAASLFGGTGSFGNGAAMRCAPVAMAACPGLGDVAALAKAQALVTHAHPEGVDGAVLLACAISIAILPPRESLWSSATITSLLVPVLVAASMRERVLLVAEAVESPERLLELARRFGTGVAAVESVPAALAVFLAHRHDPVGVFRSAIGLGGDTDTVAAMAGALSGAYLGAAALPRALLDRLEARVRIERAAQRLIAIRPIPRPI